MNRSERVKYYLYLALLYPLALLPMWVLYGISDLLYVIFYRLLKYRIKVVRYNLQSCFPDKTPEELKEIERGFYHNFCDIIVETIKLLHVSKRTLAKRIKVTNGELVDQIIATGKPIVLFLAHYGNWEWMPAMLYSYSPTIFSGHIYKKLHDEAADRVLNKARSRFPSQGMELTRATREILRLSKERSDFMIGFISDHRFNNVPRHQSMQFLNHDTPYYVGGEVIGNKIGADYLYLDVKKTGRGRYELTFVPITVQDNEANPITRRYMNLLEATIHRQPALWLWSHRRWLDKPLKRE